jgi:hypothetical protein
MNKKITYAIALSLLTLFSSFTYSASRKDTIEQQIAVEKEKLSAALEEEKFYVEVVGKVDQIKIEEFKTFKDVEDRSRVYMTYFIANHSDTDLVTVRSLILLPKGNNYREHNTSVDNLPAGQRAFVGKDRISNQLYVTGYKEPPQNVTTGIKSVEMTVKGQKFFILNGTCDQLIGVRNRIEKIKQRISSLEQKA